MESKYLTCPFDVGSFEVYTYTGKTVAQLEVESYKVFKFVEQAYNLKLYYLVTDWIRDEKGAYWFVSLKSYKLTDECYQNKIARPSA
jgi:hypothetical protein